MPSIVGELRFRQAGRDRIARLFDDRHWSCEDRQIEQFLNQACRIPPAVSDIDTSRAIVHSMYQTAERLGAEVTIPNR